MNFEYKLDAENDDNILKYQSTPQIFKLQRNIHNFCI